MNIPKSWFDLSKEERDKSFEDWQQRCADQKNNQSTAREKIIGAARAGALDAIRLDNILSACTQFGLSADDVTELKALRDSLRLPITHPAHTEPCRLCGGDGGAGHRCPHCFGNGLEPEV